ncbi:DUF4271 domain-containing protein [Aquimarina sp. ERC-38]|uniref:DUF4271 domain-containing protein n=1 Tax=Aquimarina sp. ERC-38 TaxID=2949996 RepID=UPI002246CF10|nr:DUF4271 domain-containing protein [Aquimarina sp. ERC-38]UZO82024.1 DUF4271 domain-containing protein [Aquimarina sp. ERC-38]
MEAIYRTVTSNNWLTLVILFTFILLASLKLFYPYVFRDFSLLVTSNKFFTVHQKDNKIASIFSSLLLLVQILSLSLFIHIYIQVSYQERISENTFNFIKISLLCLLVLVGKLLIEKIIATLFSIETIIDSYLIQKTAYRNLVSVLFLPVTVIFSYLYYPSVIQIQVILGLFLLIHLILLGIIYKRNEKYILKNLFYFILYLCTLEIAPYFILYKLFV